MAGNKIPVVEIEKLTLKRDGRGMHVYDDGDVLATTGWQGGDVYASGSLIKVLPAPSALAWLKVTYRSGTSATDVVGYVPVFNGHLFGQA